jgi:hypothetical protein
MFSWEQDAAGIKEIADRLMLNGLRFTCKSFASPVAHVVDTDGSTLFLLWSYESRDPDSFSTAGLWVEGLALQRWPGSAYSSPTPSGSVMEPLASASHVVNEQFRSDMFRELLRMWTIRTIELRSGIWSSSR